MNYLYVTDMYRMTLGAIRNDKILSKYEKSINPLRPNYIGELDIRGSLSIVTTYEFVESTYHEFAYLVINGLLDEDLTILLLKGYSLIKLTDDELKTVYKYNEKVYNFSEDTIDQATQIRIDLKGKYRG